MSTSTLTPRHRPTDVAALCTECGHPVVQYVRNWSRIECEVCNATRRVGPQGDGTVRFVYEITDVDRSLVDLAYGSVRIGRAFLRAYCFTSTYHERLGEALTRNYNFASPQPRVYEVIERVLGSKRVRRNYYVALPSDNADRPYVVKLGPDERVAWALVQYLRGLLTTHELVEGCFNTD